MPLPVKVPSHRLQRLWSSYLQFLVQGIGLEVPEENSDSTQEVGAANQTQATAKSHRHKAWSRLPNLCMKRIREVVLGLSGVGGMGTGSERHRLAGVTLVFFLTGKERRWRKEEITARVLPSPRSPLASQSVILCAPG